MELTLDNEPITFNGPPPPNVQTLYNLVNEAITSQGRFLTGFLVDNQPLHASQLEAPISNFQSIHITSVEESSFIKSLTEQQQHHIPNTLHHVNLFATQLLSAPLHHTLQQIDPFVKDLSIVLEAMHQLSLYGQKNQAPWSASIAQQFQQIMQALEQFLAYAAIPDVALMSEILSETLLPSLQTTHTLLRAAI